jgi:hypothetical protein
MRLIATKGLPKDKTDTLTYQRPDGSSCQSAMPRQGVLPHDLIHYVVEAGLGLRNGFLSLVARGAAASFVMDLTHGPNRAQVEREAIQAEAMVEALQTQLWSGGWDHEAFLYGVAMAAQSRGVAAPEFGDQDLQTLLYDAALALAGRWQALPARQALELNFSPEQ